MFTVVAQRSSRYILHAWAEVLSATLSPEQVSHEEQRSQYLAFGKTLSGTPTHTFSKEVSPCIETFARPVLLTGGQDHPGGALVTCLRRHADVLTEQEA